VAKNARLYEVTLRNGYGTWKKIHPAPSEADLRNTLNLDNDVKLISIKSIGWHPFSLELNDGCNDLDFTTKEMSFSRSSHGYDYLRRQFPDKAKEIDEFQKNQNQ
jgi:hypothetical protein